MRNTIFGGTLLILACVFPTPTQAFFPPLAKAGTPLPKGNPDPTPVAATPEPATIISGGLGLAALAGFRFRKQQKAKKECQA